MQESHNQRKEVRHKYKNIVQYEEYLENGIYGPQVMTNSIDIGAINIGIHVLKEFKLGSQLRITCNVSESEIITFIVKVVRIQLNRKLRQRYILGAEIISISDDHKEKLKSFLEEINFHCLLDAIDLENVVDIHFMAGYPIILKKMGKLVEAGPVLGEFRIKNLLINLLDEDSFSKFMRNKDINFILTYHERRLRFNMHFQKGKVEAVCRVVNSRIPTPAQLGLSQIAERLITNNLRGLIIISGRKGSGKTTTLASMVSHLTKIMSGVIITIEDPIEYVQEKSQCIVKQREIGEDTISYASAVRNALRQNPDVLVIGEVLDKETIDLLLLAAESGILVITTFHSPNVIQVLDRIVSFFPAEAQKQVLVRLSLTLKGVIVQDLIPHVLGNGLILATELFLVNDSSKKIIREGDWKQIPDLMLRGKTQGMHSMQDSINDLIDRGLVDVSFSK